MSIGSSLLLGAGAAAYLTTGGTPGVALVFGGTSAAVIHLTAWSWLGYAVRAVRNGRALRIAFVTSIAGFFIGLVYVFATLPFYVPVFLFFLIVPFAPPAWAPVVMSHAALFIVAARTTADRLARGLVYVGAIALMLVAVCGCLVFLAYGLFDRLSYLFAGLTAPGYVLVGVGWARAGKTAARSDESEPPDKSVSSAAT